MGFSRLFASSFVARRDRVGLELESDAGLSTLTFGEIDARVNRMARELVARGVRRGDRLCVHLGNGLAFLDLFLACTRLGIVFVPMNVLYRERELRHIVSDADPVATVVPDSAEVSYPESAPLWRADELLAAAAERAFTPLERELAPPEIGDADPALVVYTSGTTGAAKGAVLTYGNLAANARTLCDAWRITETDRYLAVLPLFHVHGLGNGVHCWLSSGCRMRLLGRFDARTSPASMREFKPTVFFGVPTIYVRLLDPAVVSDEDAREIGRAARLFVSGSAPLPAHVHAAFRTRFGHTILERYGMSEALMIMSNPYDGDRRPGSVGRPLPGVSARIVDDEGRGVADGEAGEIEIRSPHLFKEYWRRPEATAAAFHDGWFRTGDVGVRSADGYYTLRGRRGDLIISGGFNIYPREIEELLLEDPRVREAAVAGIPDDLRGEVPVAYIVAGGDVDAAELEASCRRHLASFKVPRAFVRMDALPRTALGKIQKHLLPRWP